MQSALLSIIFVILLTDLVVEHNEIARLLKKACQLKLLVPKAKESVQQKKNFSYYTITIVER